MKNRFTFLLTILLTSITNTLLCQTITAGNSYKLTDDKLNDLVKPDYSSYTYDHVTIGEDEKNITVVVLETYTNLGQRSSKVRRVVWCNIKKDNISIHEIKTLMLSTPNNNTVISSYWVYKNQLHLLCFKCKNGEVYPMVNLYNVHGSLVCTIKSDKPIKFPEVKSKNSTVMFKVSDDNSNIIIGIRNHLSEEEKKSPGGNKFIENTSAYFDNAYAFTIDGLKLNRLKFKYHGNGTCLAIDNKKNIAIFSSTAIELFRIVEKEYELSEFIVPVIKKEAYIRPLFKDEEIDEVDDDIETAGTVKAENERPIESTMNFFDGKFINDTVFQCLFSCRINQKFDSLLVLQFNLAHDNITPRYLLNTALKLFVYHSASKNIFYKDVPDFDRFFKEETITRASGEQYIIITSGNQYDAYPHSKYFYNITLIVMKLDKNGKKLFVKKMAIPGIFNSPDVCIKIQNEDEFSFLFLSQFNKANSDSRTFLDNSSMNDENNHFVLYTVGGDGESSVERLNTFKSLECKSLFELQYPIFISNDKKEMYFIALDRVWSNGRLMKLSLR